MKIAIPTFRTRVSPRFDLAARLLLIQVQGGKILGQSEEPLEHLYGWRRIEFLTARRVNVVLCGGIRRCDYFSIVDAGIHVYAGLMGEVDDILDAFLRGEISMDGDGGVSPGRGWRQARRRTRGRRANRGARDELTNT